MKLSKKFWRIWPHECLVGFPNAQIVFKLTNTISGGYYGVQTSTDTTPYWACDKCGLACIPIKPMGHPHWEYSDDNETKSNSNNS